MKRLIIIAAMVLAAIAPLSAQDFNKLNDTTWVRHFVHSDGVVTEYAYKVDQAAHIAKLNNDMRKFGLLEAGAVVAGGVAALAELTNVKKHNGKNTALDMAAVVLGIGSVGMGVAGICVMIEDRLYVSPEGVIIRIGKVEKPKPRGQRGIFSK